MGSRARWWPGVARRSAAKREAAAPDNDQIYGGGGDAVSTGARDGAPLLGQ